MCVVKHTNQSKQSKKWFKSRNRLHFRCWVPIRSEVDWLWVVSYRYIILNSMRYYLIIRLFIAVLMVTACEYDLCEISVCFALSCLRLFHCGWSLSVCNVLFRSMIICLFRPLRSTHFVCVRATHPYVSQSILFFFFTTATAVLLFIHSFRSFSSAVISHLSLLLS